MKTKNRQYMGYIAALAGVFLLVLLDQVTKYLAVFHLKGKEPYVVIENIFQLEYLENRGAAFGILKDQYFFFYISVVVICIAAVWFYSRLPMERKFLPLRIIAVILVAGALGNFIDRIRYNYVVDFFYFKLIDFPIFNVADIYVTTSAVLLVLFIFFYYKEEDLERIFHHKGTRRKES